MSLAPLIRTCFRTSRAQPLRTALLIFGIALGVAGVVAIDLARTSVSRSFELSTTALTERATHQILGNDFSLPQSLFTQLRTDLGIYKSAPVIAAEVAVFELPGRHLTLMGVDPFAERNFRQLALGTEAQEQADRMREVLIQGQGVALSNNLALSGGLGLGDTMTLEIGNLEMPLRIGAVTQTGIPMMDGLILADIGMVQELLGMGDRISRIDLALDDPAQAEQIRSILGPGQVLVETAAHNQTLRSLSASFETSLSAFSVLVLFMGIFLIYNTVSFSVARRQRLFGILRAVGATGPEIFLAVMAEVCVYALAGSALGLGLGILLGTGAVQAVCTTVSDMYYTLTVTRVDITLHTLGKGAATGLGAALLSSLAPAVNGAGTVPVTLMQASSPESRVTRHLLSLTLAGLAMLAGAAALFFLGRDRMDYVYLGVFLVFGSTPFLAPVLVFVLARILDRFSALGETLGKGGVKRHWTLARMGLRNGVRSLSRTSVLVASLMVVISVFIGVDTMTHSFRSSLMSWVDNHIGGDIHVSAPDDKALPPDLWDRILDLDGVADVSAYNILGVYSEKTGQVHLFSYARDLSVKEWTWLDPAAGQGNENKMTALLDDGWIMVSEIFARQQGLIQDGKGGQTAMLETLEGPKTFRVAGIFRDYFMGGGRAVVGRETMKTFWGRDEITAIQVFVSPGRHKADAIEGIMARIREAAGGETPLRLRSGPEIKSGILSVFDHTFLITLALEFLTALVALTGIVNSVMALILERTRELGILRACGAAPAQIRTLILWECGGLGLLAGLLSLPLGLLLSWILVAVVNLRAFGWTYDLAVEPVTLALALGFSVLAALGAGFWPAVRAGQVPVSVALRTD